jgi:predicted helicase
MSEFLIKQYQNELEKIIHFGGTKKETAIRNAFYNLINEYAKARGLMVVPEITIKTSAGKNVTPDGTLKDVLRQDWGYWESKDESDDIDDEIKKKFTKGYPKENILFEDSSTAVLIQNSTEVLRVKTKDAQGLHEIITQFINFERPEVKHFRKAIELFKQDIPKVTTALRNIIISQESSNHSFTKASKIFLKLCHDSINPNITNEDIREMIIQHILTEDVFNTIFDENQFHRENNIARELESVIHTFFTGSLRKTALSSVQHYYQAINAAAAGIADHHEKQKFLKVIYETFYKSYNPKAADRLGVVYTPNEVVQFMIKSTDYLLNKHFGKFLEDKGVEILDPATGTGTYMCDMIDYFSKDKLKYKYKFEMHANEVAILPYYISNLNIEFTYLQKMGAYEEFENLCFVDTLDNMGFTYRGKQIDMFSPFTEENSKRIRNQNDKKIAVIIGNPPYNANQVSENDNNKNREYPTIDKRIKDTFIENSTAQKTKVYDMYARFYRWAFDRLDNNGIIAFITNRSFIDSRTFDGFRKTVTEEFDFAYIVDTKSDIRSNPKLSGTTHNIFGIQTGVAIMILIRKNSKEKKKKCNIFYAPLQDDWIKEKKLQWLSENPFEKISFSHIQPDIKNNWLNQSDTDFNLLLPTVSKEGKQGKTNKVLFKIYSTGINSGRDEWIIDSNRALLELKMKYYISEFNRNNADTIEFDQKIKWSRNIKEKLKRGKKEEFSDKKLVKIAYRPFTINWLYNSNIYVDERGNSTEIFGEQFEYRNMGFGFTGPNSQKPFLVQGTDAVTDYHFVGAASSTQFVPFQLFNHNGEKLDNITDWGLNQFIKNYGKKNITKENIFYYVYAVLHNPIYKKKYELNLKQEFPRIPFYENFQQWATWGKELMNLHVNFDQCVSFDLDEISTITSNNPKPKLKVDKNNGRIFVDENTYLEGVPIEAWEYKLGNRSAIEWVLDQSGESKPKDPTIYEMFNTYRLADNKQTVISLLKKVCTVSVETVKIIKKMESVEY